MWYHRFRFAWILDGIDLTPGFTSRSPMIPQRREEISQFHVVAGSAWASVDGGTIIVGHVALILLWTDAECGLVWLPVPRHFMGAKLPLVGPP